MFKKQKQRIDSYQTQAISSSKYIEIKRDPLFKIQGLNFISYIFLDYVL